MTTSQFLDELFTVNDCEIHILIVDGVFRGLARSWPANKKLVDLLCPSGKQGTLWEILYGDSEWCIL